MEWVVLELTQRCERELPETVAASLARDLKGAEVFIPSMVSKLGGDTVVHHLMEGYAFVTNTLPAAAFNRLKDTKFVQGVMLVPGTRKFAIIPQREVDKLRGQLEDRVNQGIAIGDTVEITAGPYKAIKAVVIEEIPEEDAVQCYIRLRSKQSLITLPRSVLKLVQQTPYSKFYLRVAKLARWADKAALVLGTELPDSRVLQAVSAQLDQVSSWAQAVARIESFDRVLDLTYARDLVYRAVDATRLATLLERGKQLFSVVAFTTGQFDLRLAEITKALSKATMTADYLEQLEAIQYDIDTTERRIERDLQGEVVDNLIVDGHNLAFRCLYAPGMASLKDQHGRPTGVIYGFLRTLVALRRRFKTARVWVAWDGSSQRRKALYSEYKANRVKHSAPEGVSIPDWDQISYLRDLLPLIGCTQVWDSDEEADDVIATLVRENPIAPQCNVIFSSDRDMCQLVTDTTHLLHPSVGARREIFVVGAEGVQDLMGVPPEQVAHFKALAGDSSDNIPGVPRVPKRVLIALLKQFKTVDGIYKSGLMGLTKTQYERLRAFEPQARLNLSLTTSVSVRYSVVAATLDAPSASAALAEVSVSAQDILEAFHLN